MIVVTPANSGLGGGHCIICASGIDRHTQTMVIDTLYDKELPGHFLDGRSYVCQGCVSDIVRACGLLQATEVQTLQSDLAEFKSAYENVVSGVRKEITALAEGIRDIPLVPDISFTTPEQLTLDMEARENAKPKRGRPKAESTF